LPSRPMVLYCRLPVRKIFGFSTFVRSFHLPESRSVVPFRGILCACSPGMAHRTAVACFYSRPVYSSGMLPKK
jgi:hypothetical protein